MRYFIVFAHPEPAKSFNAALLKSGVERLIGAGHEVRVSDLYAMGFNPIASGDDFKGRRFPDRLQYDREQKHAVAEGLLSDDVAEELEKALWCDVIVLQFPLYWFSMPAIMKGWIDRVFVNSVVYGAGKRYETGGLKGRRAMVCTTTGAYERMFQPDGLLGDCDRALWHIHNGVLFYVGLEVLPPFVAWSPVHSDQATTDGFIKAYGDRLLAASDDAPMRFHRTSDFDSEFRMKPDVVPGERRPLAAALIGRRGRQPRRSSIVGSNTGVIPGFSGLRNPPGPTMKSLSAHDRVDPDLSARGRRDGLVEG